MKKKKIIVIVVVVVALLVIAEGIVFFLANQKNSTDKEKSGKISEEIKESGEDEEAISSEKPSTDEIDSEGEEKAESEEKTENEEEVIAEEAKPIDETVAKKETEEMLKQILDYENVLLEVHADELARVGSKVTIKMDEYEATRAACLSAYVVEDEQEVVHVSDEFDGRFLDESLIGVACEDLFGVKANTKLLKQDGDLFYDAVSFNNKPFLRWYLYETELGHFLIDYQIEVKESSLTCEQTVYHGYWGYGNYSNGNFQFNIEIKENSDSKYGLNIQSITIQRIADETSWNYVYENQEVSDPEGGFYGIWCISAKSVDDVEDASKQLLDAGYNAQIIYTPEWSNLNKDPYYTVTAGMYTSEYMANIELDAVKSLGFDGAYVKFSGERR